MIKKVFVFLFLVFLSVLSVKADASRMFYLDDPIPGVYTLMDKGYKKAANYVKVIRRKSDNAFVYCVMPGVAINDSAIYEVYDNNQWEHLNISEETWEKINLIAYYGYQYNDHQELEWYAVTQYLIWLEVLPQGWDVYFTNKLRGEKTNKFDDKINEILNLVNNYYKNPSINQNISLDYLDSKRLIDYNNVLDDYELIANNNIFKGINFLDLNNVSDDFSFKLNLKTDGKVPILYEYDGAQSVIIRGSLPKKELSYNVHVSKGRIKLLKKASSNINADFEGKENSLEGAKYVIYNESFYQEYTTDSNGIILTDYLKVGKYYIKEIAPSRGYTLDETIYEVDVSDGVIKDIVVWEDAIVTKLNIKKYFNYWNDLVIEEGALFGIYDLKDNLIIQKKTDNLGELTFKIPYGEYKLKQIDGKVGFKRALEEIIKVSDSSVVNKIIVNEPILSEVDIIKTNEKYEIIKNMTFQFKIYDVINERYISYEDKDVFSFGEDGKITLPIKLPYGLYTIEEIELDNNYYDTDSQVDLVIDENNFGNVQVYLVNKEKRYSINIMKQKEIYQEDKKLLVPGIDIKFCVYANEDILKHKEMLYLKDALVGCHLTDSEGRLSFSGLWYGNYIVKEEIASNNYEDFNPIEVKFASLESNLEIINYLKEKPVDEEIKPEIELKNPEEIVNIPVDISKPEIIVPVSSTPNLVITNPQTQDSLYKYIYLLKITIMMFILGNIGIFMLKKTKNTDFSKKFK